MTNKAKVKKWIKRILIVIAVLLALVWAVYDNLVSNSVYYAKYTPHKEGVEPQLMMVIEHLDDIYLPEMKEYRYDFDGRPAILIFDSTGKQESVFAFYRGGVVEDNEYDFYVINQYFYAFNNNWEFERVSDNTKGNRACNIEDFNKIAVLQDLRNKLQPLIDAQPLPDVNLQWLFDWVYHDKFN